MIISKQKFRRIIQEIAEQEFQKADESSFELAADMLAESISNQIEYDPEGVVSNSIEMIMSMLEDDGSDTPNLTRREDLDMTVEFVVKRVLGSSTLKETVRKLALELVENFMNEQH